MDKKLAGLLGAAAALTAVSGAQAAAPAQSTEAAPAASYREFQVARGRAPHSFSIQSRMPWPRSWPTKGSTPKRGPTVKRSSRTIITIIMGGGGTGITILPPRRADAA